MRRNPEGRKVVHLHLSQLLPTNRTSVRIKIVTRMFRTLESGRQAQIFSLSNDDLVMILNADTLEPVKHLRLEGKDPDGKFIQSAGGPVIGSRINNKFALTLRQAGLISNTTREVKLILSGAVSQAYTVRGIKVTKGARAAIEAAGGSIEA